MSTETLIKTGRKQNNRKSGKLEEHRKQLRLEAQERQAKYDKLTIDQKLAQPHLGAKERKKLLVKKQNQIGAK